MRSRESESIPVLISETHPNTLKLLDREQRCYHLPHLPSTFRAPPPFSGLLQTTVLFSRKRRDGQRLCLWIACESSKPILLYSSPFLRVILDECGMEDGKLSIVGCEHRVCRLNEWSRQGVPCSIPLRGRRPSARYTASHWAGRRTDPDQALVRL